MNHLLKKLLNVINNYFPQIKVIMVFTRIFFIFPNLKINSLYVLGHQLFTNMNVTNVILFMWGKLSDIFLRVLLNRRKSINPSIHLVKLENILQKEI